LEDRAVAHVVNSRFLANSASGMAGAIWLFGGATCNLTGCTVAHNTAQNGGALGIAGEGSGDVAGSRIHVRNSTMQSNSARGDGGVITGRERAAAAFFSCQFVNNSATNGGVIDLYEHATVVVGERSLIMANSAGRGAFLSIIGYASAHIFDAKFVHNWVEQDGVGGLISASGSSLVSMTDCQAVGDVLQPDVYGGACYLEANASLDLTRCTLSNYHASRGAGVATFENSRLRGSDCALINMTATIDGGGLLITSSASNSWLNGRFLHTSAPTGGAIQVSGTGWLHLSGALFVNSKAADGGGAIASGLGGAINMTGSRFINCRTSNPLSSSGGAVFVDGSASAYLTNCSFAGCHSMYGGAVAAQNDASLHMHSCRFNNNTAGTNGGALVLSDQATAAAFGCMLSNNTCVGFGGGIAAANNASLRLQQSLVVNNSADEYGGGMSLFGSAALAIVNTPVTGNTASLGGGGVVLTTSNFAWNKLQTSVRRNTATFGSNILIWATQLAVVGNSSVENFVSRLGGDDGLVNVTLNATGAQGRPAEGVLVFASLDGVVLQPNYTGADGIALMRVKLRKPPGTWMHSGSVNTTLGLCHQPATHKHIKMSNMQIGCVCSGRTLH
jgi:hypothetical protein